LAVLWYAMRSKPNKEDFLARQFEAQGVKVYNPRIRVRVVNPRARKVRPYFPGYIFVQVDLEKISRSALQWLPGSAGLVSFGGEPACVPDSLINAIRKRVDEVNASDRDLIQGLSRGQLVTIQAGPFAGHEAIFDARLSGDERVRVLLKLINKQQLPLDLPSGQIQLKKKTGTSSAK
jgi:transcription elongation factor/antiterminator RfaH